MRVQRMNHVFCRMKPKVAFFAEPGKPVKPGAGTVAKWRNPQMERRWCEKVMVGTYFLLGDYCKQSAGQYYDPPLT